MRSPSTSAYRQCIAFFSAAIVAAAVQGASSPAEAYEKIGQRYQINGRWYEPKVEVKYDRHGTASWYGGMFHGRKTANGERYNMNALSAAHPTMPLPSYAYVTNTRNGRTVLVRVNDRGPYVGNRLIDLSREVARLLGFIDAGVAPVRVTYAGKAPVNGGDKKEREFLQTQAWYTGKKPTTAVAEAPVPKTENAPQQTVAVEKSQPAAKRPVDKKPVEVAKAPAVETIASLDKDTARTAAPLPPSRPAASTTTATRAAVADHTPVADKDAAALVQKLETEALTHVMAEWRVAQRTSAPRKTIR